MFNTAITYLLNYLIIQVSIILFIAPFYVIYRRKHFADHEPQTNLNRHLEYFFQSNQANYLVFFWAFGEAFIWFIIPEFLLILMIFMRVQKKRQLLMYDIYGTILGTMVAFMLKMPERMIASLPYVQQGMVDQTRAWFDAHGVWGLIYQPLSGVPYKVFTHIGAHRSYFFLFFLIFAVLLRISRYYATYTLFSFTYPLVHKYVYRNYIKLFFITSFIFSILLFRVYNSYGPGYKVRTGFNPAPTAWIKAPGAQPVLMTFDICTPV